MVGIRSFLKGGVVFSSLQDAVSIRCSLPDGHVADVLGLCRYGFSDNSGGSLRFFSRWLYERTRGNQSRSGKAGVLTVESVVSAEAIRIVSVIRRASGTGDWQGRHG